MPTMTSNNRCAGHDGFRGCTAYSFLGDNAKMVRGAMYFGMKKDVTGTKSAKYLRLAGFSKRIACCRCHWNVVSYCARRVRFHSALYNAAAAKASQTRCRVVLSEVDDKPTALSRLEYYGTRTEYYEPIGKLDFFFGLAE